MNNRRKLIVALGAGAFAASFGARAQRPEGARRIGILMGYAENDSEAQLRLVAFKERLAALGW